MADRLVVDLDDDRVSVLSWPQKGIPQELSRGPLAWPLDANALEDLRWYLEDYLLAPFGVWQDRGPAIRDRLAAWGDQLFASVFGAGPARDAYQRFRDRGLGVLFRSADPGWLGLPWELMRDGAGPLALGPGGISRSLPVVGGAGTLEVPGGRLRVLMVISRPGGTADVGYQLVGRPLLDRLAAVRGEVDLTVLRPPTFDALRQAVTQAAEAGEPFQVVHFDGHGAMPGRPAGGGAVVGGRPVVMSGPGEGVLAFEKAGGGSDHVTASRVAAALAGGRVPVVALNACQSGAVGKELESSVATALLKAGCAAVVAMAYSVYAVAAAEFMVTFYESLFAGHSVGQAVTTGRQRLFSHDGRPSPQGDMPLADWLVPVHYLREEVRFPQARTRRAATAPSLDEALDRIRAAGAEPAAAQDPLAAVGGVFVGRDDLFYQLETAALSQRVVVLAGAGGTGKTEIAKGFARWWRDTGGVDDPRLIFWHSFEPGVASFGLDTVITSFGLDVFGADFARMHPAQRLDAVKQLLGQYRALLVWDNFESVREMPDPAGATLPLDQAGCTALKDFLDWVRDHSRSMVLITSRTSEDWLGQVRRIPVNVLNRAEAAEYASYLLGPYPAAQARRERRSFGELLEWLDGHPLAMRLTLPRLDTTSPAGLLAGLRGTEPLPGVDDPEAGRSTSLPVSMTYSYVHLPPRTRHLLPAVGLFHGFADEDLLMLFSSVEGVPTRFAGVSKQQWIAVLEDAARVGLLTKLGGGMYEVHPVLPGYLAAGWHSGDPAGYNQEREACEQALCTACAVFCRELTGAIDSGDAALAYLIIGVHRRTLGAMLGRALDGRAWSEAGKILRALDRYWNTRGLSGEAAAWADRTLDATTSPGRNTPAKGSPAEDLWLYTSMEQANRQQDAEQLDQARRTYQQILAHLEDQPEDEWTRTNISGVLYELGKVAAGQERLDEAEDCCRKALTIDEELGDQRGTALIYTQLGQLAQRRAQLDEAEDWYRKALTINEELDNRPLIANTYGQLGNVSESQGRLDEADEWHRKALTINEELGDRRSAASTYGQLGNVSVARGRLDEAEDWYRKALTINEKLGHRPEKAHIYGQLGNVSLGRGRPDEAEDWYRKALTIFEELGNRPYTALTYRHLGITAQLQGRLDEAEDWYRKGLTLSEEVGEWGGVAIIYRQLGLLAEHRDQAPLALAWTVRYVTLVDQLSGQITGTGLASLARITRQLGTPTLEATWQQVTGQSVPQTIYDYITSQHTEDGDPGITP